MLITSLLLTVALFQTIPVGTRMRTAQLAEPAMAHLSLRVVMPNGIPVYARLDPAEWTLDLTQLPPVLRVKAAAEQWFKLRAAATADPLVWEIGFTPRQVRSVLRNGLGMLEGLDYTVEGARIVATVAQGSAADDVWVVEGLR